MEKLLALAQHLGLEVFKHEGEYYVGATQAEIDRIEVELSEKDDDGQALDEFYKMSDYTRLEDEITENGDTFEYGRKEYLVLDDNEADEAFDNYLDNYIEEVVFSEIPESYQQYFDRENFKQDCVFDGRGHFLSGYDGYEHEETVDGTTYYIYRTN